MKTQHADYVRAALSSLGFHAVTFNVIDLRFVRIEGHWRAAACRVEQIRAGALDERIEAIATGFELLRAFFPRARAQLMHAEAPHTLYGFDSGQSDEAKDRQARALFIEQCNALQLWIVGLI